MDRKQARGEARVYADALVAASLFAFALLVFWLSPVEQVTDSRYSLLLSESLLYHHTFALDVNYRVPRNAPVHLAGYVWDGDVYQLELVNNHIYYYFPVGSSVLSAPYVAALNRFGISAANADATYNHAGEVLMETSLAAVLMALLTALFYCTARRLQLPVLWSIIVATGGTFGTQVWSTASRALWAHTWEVALGGVLVYLLASAYQDEPDDEACAKLWRRPRVCGAVLATLLAWMYFVRPTASVQIVCLTIYVALYHRRALASYVVTGALWLAGFILYSRHNFGRALPSYYAYSPDRVGFETFGTALLNNLVGPSRGLFVYVPILLFIGYLLVKFRQHVAPHRFLWLAVGICALHLVTVSTFLHWWGGTCYGARFTTDVVPWFVLLAIIALKALLAWRAKQAGESAGVATSNAQRRWRVIYAAGALLLALSVFINARGALDADTLRWNGNIPERQRARFEALLWDWRRPQFLGGLVTPPLDYPSIMARVDFASPESQSYAAYGWSGAEAGFRWTDHRRAAISFMLDPVADTTFQIKMKPFLVPGKVDAQVVRVSVNKHAVGTLELKETGAYVYTMRLPKDILQRDNIIMLEMPNAAAPKDLLGGTDARLLGVMVEWIGFEQAR